MSNEFFDIEYDDKGNKSINIKNTFGTIMNSISKEMKVEFYNDNKELVKKETIPYGFLNLFLMTNDIIKIKVYVRY